MLLAVRVTTTFVDYSRLQLKKEELNTKKSIININIILEIKENTGEIKRETLFHIAYI